jgi:hypothetical protein
MLLPDSAALASDRLLDEGARLVHLIFAIILVEPEDLLDVS